MKFLGLGLKFLVPVSVALASPCAAAGSPAVPKPSERQIQQLDELSALWSYYKRAYVQGGRVVSLDEGHVTTSEGQSYALLRAVWMKDGDAFRAVWDWTRRHLQIRDEDKLFAWKWKGKVLDRNAATDADQDIALALLMAAERFGVPAYREEALEILADIWRKEVVRVGSGKDVRYYVTGGNWAPSEKYPTIHVAYLAPYAYEYFAEQDGRFPWRKLVDSSYGILRWLYFTRGLKHPPEKIFVDRRTGDFHVVHPETGKSSTFGYDAFPIFWRVAVDAEWYGREQGKLRAAMLSPFRKEWEREGRVFDRYTLDGKALSPYEGLPLYTTLHSLAGVEDPGLAKQIRERKLDPLWRKAMSGKDTPYYLQNWIWFDRALELNLVRTYSEFLSFLRPFDFESFSIHFPWVLTAAMIALYPVARRSRKGKIAFLAVSFGLCVRYLHWRLFNSLNFLEPSGPFISIALWLAEFYCFSTVLLLVVQVGLRGGEKRDSEKPSTPSGFEPSVDIFIPIYSESLDILMKTLVAARAIRYGNKKIHVCDDSHRDSVREMAERYGAAYVKGPKKHAKAGNLNNAIAKSSGELLVIFDTDHIPVSSFLEETVPPFADPKIGFVQTPHHFYNEDIFQRAFGTGLFKVPDEQDMFNHAIQGGRNHWNGSFFVGSGAVFRRVAIERLGGFKLMSITEDIHTSQHLHASGWRSAFVDKDLAVGLTAENFASFVVQRRRWMQGCLQILFKDNPLFCRGLSPRQRLGYFASLYYFLHPISRVIFWATPLCYLIFHWHPIFAEVSVLVAYLLPYMIALPLISSVLLPGWPRMLWGVVYEMTSCFVLFRSMFDLLLPKSLGFKVTPKGIVSEKRSFDWVSSQANLIVAGITLAAIGKGLVEFHLFGIEKDAYFFNLAWAGVNLAFLGVGLLVAWEKPQRRQEDRVHKPIPFLLEGDGFSFEGTVHDISLGGFSFQRDRAAAEPPASCALTLKDPGFAPLRVAVRFVHAQGGRFGFRFDGISEGDRERVLLMTFASEKTWESAHRGRTRTNAGMVLHFLIGVARCFRPVRPSGSEFSETKPNLPTGLSRADGKFPSNVNQQEIQQR